MILATVKLTSVETVLSLVALAIAALGGGAGLVAFYRMKLGESTMGLLQTNNTALEDRVTELTRAHEECEERDKANKAQLAEQRGRIATIERLITGHEAIDQAAAKITDLAAANHREVMDALGAIGRRTGD